MKKYGKPLLYILVFLVISSFIENTDIYTIQEMKYSFSDPLNNLLESFFDNWFSDSNNFLGDTLYWLFYAQGDKLIALALVLIFYLGVDKKVWKS